MYCIRERMPDQTTKFLAQAPTQKDAQDWIAWWKLQAGQFNIEVGELLIIDNDSLK